MFTCIGSIFDYHLIDIILSKCVQFIISRRKTRATFEEALDDAMKKYVGDHPNILALPLTFKTTSVHLCMKDPNQDCMDEYLSLIHI